MSMTSLDLSWHAVHRMMDATRQRPVFAAVWSARLALFSGGLAIVGILLHRLLGLPTPILLNVLIAPSSRPNAPTTSGTPGMLPSKPE